MSTLSTHRGLRVFLGLTCFVIVVAGMKAAGELVLPTMMALFISLLCIPPMRRLERFGIPTVVALIIVVFLATLMVFVVVTVIGRSIAEFQAELPFYERRLNELTRNAIAWCAARGIALEPEQLLGELDSSAILRLVSDTVSGLLATVSNLLLVLLTMVFMLLEANTLPGKLRTAMDNPAADLSDFATGARRVQEYLAIKAMMSLATGACVGVLCASCGVPFPLLWALIAFLFNFVPNIGSIIAAVPVVLLAFLLQGLGTTIVVLSGFLAINMIIGNILEPRLMGRKLGLSTLVVFLSMLFWGWVWGPVGMLLSVPLTVIVKILLEHSDDLRWIAVLLGPGDDGRKPAPPASAASGVDGRKPGMTDDPVSSSAVD